MSDIKTVDTPLLRIGYEEWNPGGAATVVLTHGWPDSPRGWRGVAPKLAEAGWRVLAPALRGFAPTRFLHGDTPRSGQLSALGRDMLDFIDALGLDKPALVGHDWGARAVANACGLRPDVARALVLMSVGYGTNAPGPADGTRAGAQLLVSLVHGDAARRGRAHARPARLHADDVGHVVARRLVC